MSESTLDKIKKTIVPSLFAGAASAGIFYVMYGAEIFSANVYIAGMQVPSYAAVGLSSALGTVAGEVLTEFVLPMIPSNQSFKKYEDLVIPPAIAGLATYGVMRFMISENTEFVNSVLIGAGGAVGGKYVYDYTLGK